MVRSVGAQFEDKDINEFDRSGFTPPHNVT